MLAERFRTDAPNFFLISCFSRSRRQITEHLPASIFDHPFCHIQDRGEYAAHAAVVVPNRTVRKGEITLFEVVVTVDREHLACEVAGLLTVCHHPVEPWS
jgi:hypothetical protein